MSASYKKSQSADPNAVTSSASGLSESTESAPIPRSTFISVLTAGLSFLLITIPAAIGGLFFLDPILRKKTSAKGGSGAEGTSASVARKDDAGFIRLDITTDTIPVDGTPVAVTVRDDLDDAWNRFPDVPVGSIWLRRNPDGAIVAFNSVCPHLGCSVNYRRGENDFFCPCHTSAFALDGKKTNEIPPRDMDSLAVAVRKEGQDDPAGTELWVRFENFRRTIAEKIPL
ncbi:MAG: ubiquinol-cytochrome c reductase iron-sulfur subunit [Planctomyces sp.]